MSRRDILGYTAACVTAGRLLVVLSAQLPLLLASPRLADPSETQPLDRIRMQKAVFLVNRNGPKTWRTLYEFEPYNWGPFCRPLQDDLRQLVAEGRMELRKTHLQQYPSYVTSGLGTDEANGIFDEIEPAPLSFLRDVRKFVTTRSFNQLLRDVYGAFPEFAAKSQFIG
jgi:uncharacterized protein